MCFLLGFVPFKTMTSNINISYFKLKLFRNSRYLRTEYLNHNVLFGYYMFFIQNKKWNKTKITVWAEGKNAHCFDILFLSNQSPFDRIFQINVFRTLDVITLNCFLHLSVPQIPTSELQKSPFSVLIFLSCSISVMTSPGHLKIQPV